LQRFNGGDRAAAPHIWYRARIPNSACPSLMNRRLGAGSYLICMSSVIIAWSLLVALACVGFAAKGNLGLAGLNTLVSTSGTAVGIVFYGASARRLRDLNIPGWAVKVLAFPLIAVIVLPLLCFLSGPRWANDFGAAPAPSGLLKTAAALMLFGVAIGVSPWALGVYLHMRHALLAGAI